MSDGIVNKHRAVSRFKSGPEGGVAFRVKTDLSAPAWVSSGFDRNPGAQCVLKG